jgi:hypothetical protein
MRDTVRDGRKPGEDLPPWSRGPEQAQHRLHDLCLPWREYGFLSRSARYARSGVLRVYAPLASLCTLALARHRFHPRRAVVPAITGNAEEIPSPAMEQT